MLKETIQFEARDWFSNKYAHTYPTSKLKLKATGFPAGIRVSDIQVEAKRAGLSNRHDMYA
jgi:hypothetical protein